MPPAGGTKAHVVGRYALFDEIGHGGMAAVHLGRLLGPVGFARTVAVKRLHPQHAKDPEFAAMFLDEARLAARIRHPNVVQTVDVVWTEDELLLVLEYVQGDSLSRLLKAALRRGQPAPVPVVVGIMTGALQGLHAAHEARSDLGEPLGIVHRDVSPQNIMVGVDGVARVLDFGIAKAAGRLQTTRAGQLKGKMSYMAPEQLRGGEIDRRTDVYAAGLVLWEALTGVRCFTGENEAEVFGKALQGGAPAPSQVVAGLPPELDAVVVKALAPKPEDRFASARDMARALENAVPLVSQSTVGEWVEATADDLSSRSEKVSRIEAESSGISIVTFSGSIPRPVAVSTPAPIAASTKRVALAAAGGLGASFVIGMAVWTLFLRHATEAVPAVAAASSAAVTVVATPPPPPAAEPVPGASASSAPDDDSSASAQASAAPAPPPPPASPPAATPPARAATRPTPQRPVAPRPAPRSNALDGVLDTRH